MSKVQNDPEMAAAAASKPPVKDKLEINHSIPICSSESFSDVPPDDKRDSAVCKCDDRQIEEGGGGEKKSRCARCGDSFLWFGKGLWSLTKTHLGLFIILIGYTFLGGALMNAVENRAGNAHVQNAADDPNVMNISWNTNESDFRSHFIQTLKNSYSELASVDDSVVAQILEDYDNELAKFKDSKEDLQVDYWSWVLFCLTVYTTIGYGHIAPKSRPGRICTMAYATIGVPLFLMTMGKLGKLFTVWLKYFYNLIRKCYYSKSLRCLRKTKVVRTVSGGMSRLLEKTSLRRKPTNPEEEEQDSAIKNKTVKIEAGDSAENDVDGDGDDESYQSIVIDDKFNLNPIVAIIVTALYIVLGATAYPVWEQDWSYHEAFYFIFISISTIGFGDLVPQHPKFFLLSSFYIIIGLALVAMVINVLIEFFTVTIEHITEEMQNVNVGELFKRSESMDIKSGIAMMHNLNREGSTKEKTDSFKRSMKRRTSF